jgi:heme exporter protein D
MHVRMEIILQDYINASYVKNLFILSVVQFQYQIVMKNMDRKEYVRTVIEKSRRRRKIMQQKYEKKTVIKKK